MCTSPTYTSGRNAGRRSSTSVAAASGWSSTGSRPALRARTACSSMSRYKDSPISVTWPLCCSPSSSPAPRISRSWVASTNPAPSSSIGSIDHDGVGGGHVDAALDDGGAHQHAEAAMIEIDHQLLELALAHLPVADAQARFRHEGLQFCRDLADGAHLVVHEIDLPAAAQLAQRRLAQRRRMPLDEEGLDGEPPGRGGRDQRQVAQPAERHVERARNRRRGEGEHVHVGAQRLQALLVAHAEAMLLVDDEEAEVVEARVRVQQAVRGDDDVDLALLESLEHGAGLGSRAEARQ